MLPREAEMSSQTVILYLCSKYLNASIVLMELQKKVSAISNCTYYINDLIRSGFWTGSFLKIVIFVLMFIYLTLCYVVYMLLLWWLLFFNISNNFLSITKHTTLLVSSYPDSSMNKFLHITFQQTRVWFSVPY
jgi:hypothetical protein